MNFKEVMMQKAESIEEMLKDWLPEETGYQKIIFEAMNYSVMAGGKRLRPMLMMETYQMVGGEHDAILKPFMAAIEMIHTYSLVHDDLPAMDNDLYRRGKKTTWAEFGEDMAILAGDALLNYAFETAAKSFDYAKDEQELRACAKALQILSEKAGVYGMVGGQVVDVALSGKAVEEDVLNFIYMMKTGALIEASMMVGAVLADVSAERLAHIQNVAGKTGLAFQIEDDILDVTSTLEELGKPTLSDEKNEKTTYVTLYGVEEAGRMAAQISEEAVCSLHAAGGQGSFLEELIRYLVVRKN